MAGLRVLISRQALSKNPHGELSLPGAPCPNRIDKREPLVQGRISQGCVGDRTIDGHEPLTTGGAFGMGPNRRQLVCADDQGVQGGAA